MDSTSSTIIRFSIRSIGYLKLHSVDYNVKIYYPPNDQKKKQIIQKLSEVLDDSINMYVQDLSIIH